MLRYFLCTALASVEVGVATLSVSQDTARTQLKDGYFEAGRAARRRMSHRQITLFDGVSNLISKHPVMFWQFRAQPRGVAWDVVLSGSWHCT
jgi:hypothetical protein